ncbi:MAG: DUF2283 domain-containing protein [bacterium]
MKPKINYDSKVNILSIKLSNKKSIDSDIKNNIVMDYAKNGDITNIDVMGIDISEFTDLNLLASHPMHNLKWIVRDKSKKDYQTK